MFGRPFPFHQFCKCHQLPELKPPSVYAHAQRLASTKKCCCCCCFVTFRSHCWCFSPSPVSQRRKVEINLPVPRGERRAVLIQSQQQSLAGADASLLTTLSHFVLRKSVSLCLVASWCGVTFKWKKQFSNCLLRSDQWTVHRIDFDDV